MTQDETQAAETPLADLVRSFIEALGRADIERVIIDGKTWSTSTPARVVIAAMAALRSVPVGLSEEERKDALAALRLVRSLIVEGAMTGFNCHDGDWAERLFTSQATTKTVVDRLSQSAGGGVPAGWQPIETAPRDGSNVLLFDADTGPVVGYWLDSDWQEAAWRLVGGKFSVDDPTHWQPLPAPPGAMLSAVPAPPPTDADMRAFSASDAACYKWPEDTPEHRAARSAYCEGAADYGAAAVPAPPAGVGEGEPDVRKLANLVTVYQIEGDDAVHINVCGVKIGAFGPSTERAIALLRYEAERQAVVLSHLRQCEAVNSSMGEGR